MRPGELTGGWMSWMRCLEDDVGEALKRLEHLFSKVALEGFRVSLGVVVLLEDLYVVKLAVQAALDFTEVVIAVDSADGDDPPLAAGQRLGPWCVRRRPQRNPIRT